eukprot:CAMPEP_0168544630 /NCGR_PEP_ID=MMETSP0413-20121227/2528_1 /TAXON_ID=136452 /ORGANISM="Filamoeba nolandi, Strain NC-AS-23-1" /LENGTH=351 /DNA_ID=CAMNT_0008574675 /DNA_START=167 /DNA_END=1222 /DNA_ORIENTATION=-
MTAGVLFYIVCTVVIGAIHSFAAEGATEKYWSLRMQSYTQGLFLNVCHAAYLVLFLLYTPSSNLLHYVCIKVVMGAIGNGATSVSTLSDHAVGTTKMSWVMNAIGCGLLLISWFSVLHHTNQPPVNNPRGQNFGKNKRRHIAIVLLTFFFFSAASAIAPILYGLRDFASDLFDASEKQAFEFTIGSYLGQELIILAGGLAMMKSRKRKLKNFTILLSLTSLAQLLFFTPKILDNNIVPTFLVVWLGLYRLVPEIFCYYLFARHIQDQNHIAFWVASMNTTLVIAELVGYPLISTVTTLFDDHFRFAIAAAGVFCVLGIALAFRLYHSSYRPSATPNKRSDDVPNSPQYGSL